MKILVIGDSCIDRHINCTVKGVNAEAPSLVINTHNKTENPGMAANVYRSLQALAEPDWQIDFLTNKNQITKTRYVEHSSGYILIRVDENDSVDVPANIKDIGIYDHYVISDYAKGFVTEDLIEAISKKGKVWLDTKKIVRQDWADNVFCLKVNHKEANNIRNSGGDIISAKYTIETLGGHGAVLYQKDGSDMLQFEGKKVEVRDVSGCGDTFFAALVCEYVRTLDFKKAIPYANKAAAVAASRRGVVVIKKEEIL